MECDSVIYSVAAMTAHIHKSNLSNKLVNVYDGSALSISATDVGSRVFLFKLANPHTPSTSTTGGTQQEKKEHKAPPPCSSLNQGYNSTPPPTTHPPPPPPIPPPCALCHEDKEVLVDSALGKYTTAGETGLGGGSEVWEWGV